MKRIQGVAALAGVLMTLCAAGAYGADDPFPPKEIPGIAYDRDLCMWRINKSFDGKAKGTLALRRAPADRTVRCPPTNFS